MWGRNGVKLTGLVSVLLALLHQEGMTVVDGGLGSGTYKSHLNNDETEFGWRPAEKN